MPTKFTPARVLVAISVVSLAGACATQSAASSTAATVTATTPATATTATARGATSAESAITRFLAAVRADDANEALTVASPRVRSTRDDASAWNLFWAAWRAPACELRSLGELRDGDVREGAVSVAASVALRCADRDRQSTIRLERVGDRWFWNEN